MNRDRSIPSWQQTMIIMAGVVIAGVLILVLQWGRPVLIPISLAILLTFLVNPIVKSMHRRGLNRAFSVLLSVTVVGTILICTGWVVAKQVTAMLAELPDNTAKIKAKVKTLKELGSGPTQDRIAEMMEEISKEFSVVESEENNRSPANANDSTVPRVSQLAPVIVRSEPIHWLSFTGYLGSAVEVLATLTFVMILLVFFLIERDDLHDRVVLLAGRARLALTSRALEDITDRVSRYIGMVAIVNGGFGVILMIGLSLLGVPYSILWGFIAGTLRFLPYLGPWIGALFPITMSLATSDGWWQPLIVFIFIMVVELVVNNVFEPLLFGHMTGVSPTALLVSAAFWLYVWGPIGLVISAPFAVCLVVLGKNVKELGFLYLLMGNKPALEQTYNFYQRALLGDYPEAMALAANHTKKASPETIFDELLIPVLNYARLDLQRQYLTEAEKRNILEGVRLTISRLNESWPSDNARHEPLSDEINDRHSETCTTAITRRTIVCCPATDETDHIALEMLKQVLDPDRWKLQMVSNDTLTSELLTIIQTSKPSFVYIMSIPPGSIAHARYLCKRLRHAARDVEIIVGRCGGKMYSRHDRDQLLDVGAAFVVTSIIESRNLLNSRWLLEKPESPSGSSHEGCEASTNIKREARAQVLNDAGY